MAYNYLDEFAGLDRAFTIAYRITDDGGDLWTARFNRFKARDKEARLGGGQVFATAVPALMQAIGADPADSIFIPALSSGETVCTEKGFVSRLAKWTAGASGALYAPGVLRKQEHRPIHGIYDAGKHPHVCGDVCVKKFASRQLNDCLNEILFFQHPQSSL